MLSKTDLTQPNSRLLDIQRLEVHRGLTRLQRLTPITISQVLAMLRRLVS
jgi:hypothetical protein